MRRRAGAMWISKPISDYTPVNEHSNWKWTLWRCISYWKWGYSIAMLVYQRVCFSHFFVLLCLSLSLSLYLSLLCLVVPFIYPFRYLRVCDLWSSGRTPQVLMKRSFSHFSHSLQLLLLVLDRDVDSLYLRFGENVFVSSITPRLNFYSPEKKQFAPENMTSFKRKGSLPMSSNHQNLQVRNLSFREGTSWRVVHVTIISLWPKENHKGWSTMLLHHSGKLT